MKKQTVAGAVPLDLDACDVEVAARADAHAGAEAASDAAKAHHKKTRSDESGAAVLAAAHAVDLAQLALDGAREDQEQARETDTERRRATYRLVAAEIREDNSLVAFTRKLDARAARIRTLDAALGEELVAMFGDVARRTAIVEEAEDTAHTLGVGLPDGFFASIDQQNAKVSLAFAMQGSSGEVAKHAALLAPRALADVARETLAMKGLPNYGAGIDGLSWEEQIAAALDGSLAAKARRDGERHPLAVRAMATRDRRELQLQEAVLDLHERMGRYPTAEEANLYVSEGTLPDDAAEVDPDDADIGGHPVKPDAPTAEQRTINEIVEAALEATPDDSDPHAAQAAALKRAVAASRRRT